MDLERIQAIVGAEGIAVDNLADWAVNGVAPRASVAPGDREQAAALLVLAREEGWALTPWGGGTQIHFGNAPSRLDLVLSTRRLNRVVDYQPDDMTATVEPGVTLAALQELLATRGQFLPLNPPAAERGTVGGLVATAASGPWRAMYGTPRDWVIGCRVVGTDGCEIRGGGQVVKNVAGYDLPKLYTGSFGSLGLITEVTFKVMPAPPHLGVCRVPVPSAEALEALLAAVMDSDLQPVSLDVEYEAETRGWSVLVEFRSVPEAVDWQAEHLSGLAGGIDAACERLAEPEASAALSRLVERPLAQPFLARISAVSSQVAALGARLVSACERAGVPPLVWAHGASGQLFVQSASATEALAADLRNIAAEAGCQCVFPRLPAELAGRVDPWGSAAGELKLMRGLKDALDPAGVFSPGRFVGGI